jgi:hypothetical protein
MGLLHFVNYEREYAERNVLVVGFFWSVEDGRQLFSTVCSF